MFSNKYFAPTFFAPRYWPEGQGVIIVPDIVADGWTVDERNNWLVCKRKDWIV